jgi:hypothetical protein
MPKDDNALNMNPQKQEAFVSAWLKEVNDALKREKKFRQLGNVCVKLYEAKTPEETPFAILYSNTETLIPAVYNQKPIPVVQRRFKDPDPNGRAVSEVSTRSLKFLLDTEDKDNDNFDELMQAAVLDGLVTNRGLCRFRYHGDETLIKNVSTVNQSDGTSSSTDMLEPGKRSLGLASNGICPRTS